jgi:uncharacterized membrane protein
MKARTLLQVAIVLCLIGVALSAYSFLHNRSFIEGSFCNLNSTFSCDVVNKGPYSTLLGVPVALIGILGYGFMLLGCVLKWRQPADRSLTVFVLLASAGGIAFSLYLTAIEAFVLEVWCVICLGSQFTIMALHAVMLWIHRLEKKTPLITS